MKRVLRPSCAVLACMVVLVSAMRAQKTAVQKLKSPLAAVPSLTGIWQANDQGTYQIRQEGTKVWWYGRSPNNGRDWQNVFCGVITNDQLVGDWVDLPPGGAQSGGSLQIQIQAMHLTKLAGTGGFGGSEWVPASGIPSSGGASLGNLGAELANIDPRSRLPGGYRITQGGGSGKADSVIEIPQDVAIWFDDSASVLEGVMRRLAGDEAVNRYLDWEQRQHPSTLQRVDLRLKAINKVVH